MSDSLKPSEYLRLARELEKTTPDSAQSVIVLSTFTAELMRPYVIVESDRLGIPIRPWFGPINQLEQLVLDGCSPIWKRNPDVIWIAIRMADVDRWLALESAALPIAETKHRLDQLLERTVALARAIRERCAASILVSNYAADGTSIPEFFDSNNPDGFAYSLADCNRRLVRELATVGDAHVFDYVRSKSRLGDDRWYDPRLWYSARAVGGAEAHIQLSKDLTRTIATLLLPAAKCVVVDLDNTLWGGVLGDDGLDGLQLGDDYPGSVFKDLQALLLGLRKRGFILAIASKNDREQVLRALSNHPEMLLRPEHFACIEAHWEPKCTSLRRIAQSLNIGLDSLVFVDDNPVERAAVRAELPMVHVVEMPTDPLHFAAALQSIPSLDRPRLSKEDLRRADMYKSELERRAASQENSSLEEFLASLQMEAEVGICDDSTLERVFQLIQKTNQFNLTTRRHKLETIRSWCGDTTTRVAWLRLRDRYGDMGLVCVGILIKRDSAWEIDTFLMSCRVMGRGVEDAFLAYLSEMAIAAGPKRLLGVYTPTAKNKPVEGFYADREFSRVPDRGAAEQLFEANLDYAKLSWPKGIRRLDNTKTE